MDISDVIWIDPQRQSGKPCFRGTRVPVQLLIDYLEAGESVNEFLRQYPWVPAQLVRDYLRLAHEHLLAEAA